MINAMKSSPSPTVALKFLLFLLGSTVLQAAPNWLAAPVPHSPPVNQLRTDGNACGPACLLDAFRAGSTKWQTSIAKVEGKTDTAKLKKIIRVYGKRGSQLDPKRARWNGRFGVGGSDLADMANELRRERWMGTVKQEIFFKTPRETNLTLLKRAHKRLSTSLKNGLPPILRVRRVAYRAPLGSSTKSWLAVKRHYLVLTGLPAKLPKNATSFVVTYHDPWGGKSYQGSVHIPDAKSAGLATLVADFPKSTIGKTLVRKGEPTCLSFSSAIGVF
ncbi:MAG: hypothetical protein ACJAQT_002224 [Akkermansiaceae bacterium]|jgi:hypothetical protein